MGIGITRRGSLRVNQGQRDEHSASKVCWDLRKLGRNPWVCVKEVLIRNTKLNNRFLARTSEPLQGGFDRLLSFARKSSSRVPGLVAPWAVERQRRRSKGELMGVPGKGVWASVNVRAWTFAFSVLFLCLYVYRLFLCHFLNICFRHEGLNR